MPISDELYRNILDNLGDGVYFVDAERKITYWNKGAEKITGYAGSDMLGKDCSDILQHVEEDGAAYCRGACPNLGALTDGLPEESEVYLCHKDGHRVPVWMRATPIRDGGGKVIGAIETFNEMSPRSPIARRIRELQRMALLDDLTMTAGRRYMEMSLHARLNELQMFDWPFGVMAAAVNDSAWPKDDPMLQDRILKTVAATLQHNIRSTDILGRWGEKEFLAIVLNVTQEDVHSVAGTMRSLIEKSRFSSNERGFQVTVSIGATLARANDTTGALLGRVGRYQQDCMERGGNCAITDMGDSAVRGEEEAPGSLADEEVVDAVPSDTQQQEAAAMVEEMYQSHESLGYYKMLGLKEHASEGSIREAHRRLSAFWRVDRFPGLTEGLKGKLEKVAAYLDAAHETLIDPEKRKKYDRTLKLREKDSPVNIGMAREKFIKGWDYLRGGDYAAAARHFAEAVYYGPSAKNHYYHGLSLARLGEHKEAERALREAALKDPKNPDCLAEIGHIYIDLGLPKRAKGNLEKALRLHPDHKRAAEGMSRLQKGQWE